MRIGLQERARRQYYAVEYGIVLKAFGGEDTDPAAAEDVISQESSLSQAAAMLILAELQVLEAGECARLEGTDTVDDTDIELPFTRLTGIVDKLTLRLHRLHAGAAEGREERAV